MSWASASRRRAEPRWKPDRPLGERITKVGRFRKVDPRRSGRVLNRYQWAGLLGWVLVVGGAFAKAWRDRGGLTGPDAGDAGTSASG